MSAFLKSLGKLFAFGLTGRIWTKEVPHPYFQNLIYFGSKKGGASYWEAELTLPANGGRIGVTMDGTPEGPTPKEEEFCRHVLGNLDALFERCRAAFEAEYPNWVKGPVPANLHEAMALDGFHVPRDGDASLEWQVCYFVAPAHHYFTAVFQNGKVSRVDVDG